MIIRGDILQEKAQRKIKSAQSQDNNTNGGFKYRINYDNFLREISKKSDRSRKRNKIIIFVTLSVVFMVCTLSLMMIILHERGFFGVNNNTLPAFKNHRDERNYDSEDFGDFVCESVSAEAVGTYHLPSGVVLTYVSSVSNYHYNDSKLCEGDIITSVDGVKLTCVKDFSEYVKSKGAGYLALLDVYRKGELIEVSYVLN